MTYQAPTTGLHSPTLILILQKSTDYLMLAQSWKFGVRCCSIGLTHPAACTRVRVPLTFGHVHRPPLLPNILKKGANRLGLSWIPLMYFKFCGCGPENNWRPSPPQISTSPGDHRTPPPPGLSCKIQDEKVYPVFFVRMKIAYLVIDTTTGEACILVLNALTASVHGIF
jgi:hypothetical protein